MDVHKQVLDFFGQVLMSRVRDEAVGNWERRFEGEMKDDESKKLVEALSAFSPEQVKFMMNLVPKIVDTTLHHLLWTLEQEEEISVVVQVEENKFINIREVSDGLCGELYTEDGWIARFSNN